MNGDVDFGAMTGQRFIDGVIQHFKHAVMQTSAVRGVANVHARALAYRFQSLKNLDRGSAILGILWRGRLRGVVVRNRGPGDLLKQMIISFIRYTFMLAHP